MISRRGVLVLALLAAPLAAQTFAPPVQHTMGTMPYGLVVTDLSGDGLLDVATANRIETSVSVRLGDGAGGLGAETSHPLPGLTEATDLAVGDVTGDGLLDLVACGNTVMSSAIVVLRGLGGGAFAAAVAYPFPDWLAQLTNLRLADFDGDGDLDAVGGTEFNKLLYVARNDGGAFTLVADLETIARPCTEPLCIDAVLGVGVADLDGDGDVDVACSNLAVLDLALFDNGGAGGLKLATSIPVHGGVSRLLLRDIDEDGHLDVLGIDGFHGVNFLPGDGAGGFGDAIASSISGGIGPFVTGPTAIGLADLDGDGRLDVAAAHDIGSTHEMLVALGNGAGSFAAPVSVATIGPLAARVEPADLDRDGRVDLVVTDSGDGSQVHDTITLLRNTTAPAPPWTDSSPGLAGTLGAPYLMPFGPLTPASAVELSLSGGKPGAPAIFVLGTVAIYARFKGGTLVPEPQLLLAGFHVEPDGGIVLSSPWPSGVPSGVLFSVQWWIVDAGGPKGFASSNGVNGLVP